MRTRPRRLLVAALALFTAATALPAAAAERHGRQEHPSHGGLSAVIRLTRLTLDPADPTVYLVDGKRERMTSGP